MGILKAISQWLRNLSRIKEAPEKMHIKENVSVTFNRGGKKWTQS